jgi:hypothetical protein
MVDPFFGFEAEVAYDPSYGQDVIDPEDAIIWDGKPVPSKPVNRLGYMVPT